jgi:hypothetical protein
MRLEASRAKGHPMNRGKATFDPKEFLAKVGEGKTISKYRKDHRERSRTRFFYIQQGKVKLTVVSEQGKEAVVAILGPGLRTPSALSQVAALAKSPPLHRTATPSQRPCASSTAPATGKPAARPQALPS